MYFVFLAMPFELYWLWRQYPWVFGDIICDAKMLMTETVTYSSIFTIVAFSVERYDDLCFYSALIQENNGLGLPKP